MAKCCVCGMDVKSQPTVKTDGTCSECKEKLEMKKGKK